MMKKFLFCVLFLSGCQSLNEHLTCINEVDRLFPAKTEQRFVKTDYTCSVSSSGIISPTTTRGGQYIVNSDKQTTCESNPIYETVILNQSQRNDAYDSCRNRLNKTISNTSNSKQVIQNTGQIETQYCKELLQKNIHKWTIECSIKQ